MIKQDFGIPFVVTAAGTSVVTATMAGTTAAYYYITDVQVSSQASQGTFAVYAGSTILWQGQIGNVPYIHSWNQPIKGTVGGSVSITANGSGVTYANMSGFQLNVGPS